MCTFCDIFFTSQWRHDERDDVWNHWRLHCFQLLLQAQIKENIKKLRITGLCAGNSQVTGEFPAQNASNVENGSIWWRHHAFLKLDSSRCSTFYRRTREYHEYRLCTWLSHAACTAILSWPRDVESLISDQQVICEADECVSMATTSMLTDRGMSTMLACTRLGRSPQGPILLTWINSKPSMDK